jgi:predicted DNA-binding protein (MmcQ/YjbR family)
VNRGEVLEFCLSRREAVEDYPFGDDVAVFKVAGRMFALVMLAGEPGRLNLKCDPDLALALRAEYPAVTPGYHANKRHWNTVELNGSIKPDDLREMIDHSYELIVSKLPRAERNRLHGDAEPGKTR